MIENDDIDQARLEAARAQWWRDYWASPEGIAKQKELDARIVNLLSAGTTHQEFRKTPEFKDFEERLCDVRLLHVRPDGTPVYIGRKQEDRPAFWWVESWWFIAAVAVIAAVILYLRVEGSL